MEGGGVESLPLGGGADRLDVGVRERGVRLMPRLLTPQMRDGLVLYCDRKTLSERQLGGNQELVLRHAKFQGLNGDAE